jgi:hypothetical protein
MTQPYPIHVDGTPFQLPYTTIATFPMGTFLENIAIRSNGHLLVSDMLGGTIYHLGPPRPRSSINNHENLHLPTAP